MTGGLMQLVAQGQQNIILNGNPSKSFWKSTYAKYTNFGLQHFRLDYEGNPSLRLTEESTFNFKVKRYADLLMDCYLSVTLPNIWSPIMPPRAVNTYDASGNPTIVYTPWAPYEFKWIENLGAQMISNITITCGNQTLQTYSGRYILASVQRDVGKIGLFDEMSGNTAELNDPANDRAHVNSYPNAFYTDSPAGAQPSIKSKTIYIPLGAWFNLRTTMAFPLVSLQYNELQISVTFRPICELFRIRDVLDYVNQFPYVAPNFNLWYMQMYRFLQTPPDEKIGIDSYTDTRSIWNADINMACTYSFLSNDESRLFAKNEQKYMFKQVHEKVFYNVSGQNKVDLDSMGLVTGWMFYFQRSDVNLRNEWSNFTNWPYNYVPNDSYPGSSTGNFLNPNTTSTAVSVTIGPGVNTDGSPTGLFVSGAYNPQNIKDILIGMGILLDGQYRENVLPVGIFNYIEKYTRTASVAPDGVYVYNFCLNASPSDQPSGAMNMNKFKNIQLEFSTIVPPLDPLAQVLTICDPTTGEIIGINKPTWRIFDYNFNLYVFEERINVVTFIGGNAGLIYAT
jgi:hypothetical protein